MQFTCESLTSFGESTAQPSWSRNHHVRLCHTGGRVAWCSVTRYESHTETDWQVESIIAVIWSGRRSVGGPVSAIDRRWPDGHALCVNGRPSPSRDKPLYSATPPRRPVGIDLPRLTAETLLFRSVRRHPTRTTSTTPADEPRLTRYAPVGDETPHFYPKLSRQRRTVTIRLGLL